MTGPPEDRQPRRDFSPSQQVEIATVVAEWARQLPPSTALLEFLSGGQTVRARDVVRAMDQITAAKRSPEPPIRDLADHILDVFAVNAREFGLADLLSRFNERGSGTARNAGSGPALAPG
jgi:hypothetical protein